MTLAILADDLTGACDTGSLFARSGPVPVLVWPADDSPALTATPVSVIDTESRRLEPGVAAARVSEAARRIRARRYFKKIDSTLRGRVGAEIEAAMSATGAARALVCPAFPAQRRVVVDRVLRVGDTPVADTPVARDPEFPRRTPLTSSVVDLLRFQLTRPLAWVPLAAVRAGADALAARLLRLGGMVIVADAETEDDLDRLVEAALAVEPAPLLVGAAGLAHALAQRLRLLGPPVALPPARRWLLVVGSLHPVARRQADAARRAGLTVVSTPDIPQADGADVVRRLADDVRGRLAGEPFDVIAVTGGETTLAVYRALEAARLELAGAPAPGLSLGSLKLPRQRDVWLVTKAGGFGEPELFASLAAA